jgi:hypothetical protein
LWGCVSAASASREILRRRDLGGISVGQYGGGFFKSAQRVETYDELERCGRDADALAARLEIRLGADHEAVKSFIDANEAVLAIYRALGMIRLESDPAPDPSAAKQVTKIIDDERDKISRARETFDDRRDAFMDAAQRTAGAKLPAPTSD